MTQREVKVAIQVQDDCETWCADCYWLDLSGWCRLFEMNLMNKYPGDRTKEYRERCSECLTSEFEPCKCHDPECDVFDIIVKGKPCNCYLKYKEEVELQDAVLNPGEGINEQDRGGFTICVLRKDLWNIQSMRGWNADNKQIIELKRENNDLKRRLIRVLNVAEQSATREERLEIAMIKKTLLSFPNI